MPTRICTINARGGSKGFPGKNWAILDGNPLIVHSIRHAKKSGLFDAVLVSSDSKILLDLALGEGVLAIERPSHLASDFSPKVPSIIHAVESGERITDQKFDTVVDLDVTSPLRNIEDIVGAVELLEAGNLKSVFSVTESRRSPYFNLVAKDSAGTWGPAIRKKVSASRRQDVPETFDMNASIYVWNRDSLLLERSVFTDKSEVFIMPFERSWDIDSKLDFELVEFLLSRKANST